MNRARLDPHRPPLRVDPGHAIHVRGEVQDDPRPQRLARQAGSAAARRHRNAYGRRVRNDTSYVRFVPGGDDGKWLAAEDARGGGEEGQRDGVGPHLANEEGPKIALDLELSWIHESPRARGSVRHVALGRTGHREWLRPHRQPGALPSITIGPANSARPEPGQRRERGSWRPR